jgi:hypothetical protein
MIATRLGNLKDRLAVDRLLRIAQQEQEHAKCLGLDRKHLAALGETELPFANFYVSECVIESS